MTEPLRGIRLPTHLVVLLGGATAMYSGWLAGVAGLQSHADGSLAVLRAPAVQGAADAADANDSLTGRLEAARLGYERLAARYQAAGASLDALDAQLADLSGVVAGIDGVSRTLPTTVKLPPIRTSVSSVGAPTTHATTGASGAK